MCGICGFTWEDEKLIQVMTNYLKHRGPDAYGYHVSQGVSLGHTRLAIIDLSSRGCQPIANETNNIYLIANGEIYNHKYLRKILEKNGHDFKSDSDSEVILHAYEEWGPRCVERFIGMFCFAILDHQQGYLILARDRLGIKPLYYYHKGNQLIFANEIKAMLAWPSMQKKINIKALYQYIGYEFVPAPQTMFEGIYKLKQGYYALFNLNTSSLKEIPYWDLVFQPRFKRPGEAIEELKALLKQSIKRRLMSDVPLGVFLSGGLDSTTIIALMRSCGVEEISSYSITYPDSTFSELEYANDMAQYYQTKHTTLMIDNLQIEDLETAIYHLDEPMSDLSTIPFMLICRKARKNVVVALSGEGGDEIFCGYDRFKASKAAQYFQRIPGLLKFLNLAASQLTDQPQKKGAINIFKRFVEGSHLPIDGEQLRWQYFLKPGQAELLFNDQLLTEICLDPFQPVREILKNCNSNNRVDREIYIDLKLAMAENVLMKVDKMSMSTSLEVRVPFLDHEFVEFTAALPSWFKLKGFTTKYILRLAVKGLVPNRVIKRSKQGYSLPIKNFLRKNLRSFMEDLLYSSPLIKLYLRPIYIAQLIKEHMTGIHNHNHLLWSLLNAALWHRRFLETN